MKTADEMVAQLEAKALLLCEHAEQLSLEIVTSVRGGKTEHVLELQARKHTLLAALSAMLCGVDVANVPALQRAGDRLKETLKAEMRLLAEMSAAMHLEQSAVASAQKRLTQVSRYEPGGAESPGAGTNEFSVRG
jgi:hypothetical protein